MELIVFDLEERLIFLDSIALFFQHPLDQPGNSGDNVGLLFDFESRCRGVVARDFSGDRKFHGDRNRPGFWRRRGH